MKKLLVCIALASPALVAGDEPLTEEQRARAEEKPLELDPVEVIGEALSFEQEVTLRILRGALDRPRSHKPEDKDVWVCWVDEATGSHLNYLNCARNGDLWALERPFGLAGPTVPSGGYGTILRSSRPVNRRKLERVLEQLPGDETFDQEFLHKVMAGQHPPRDIPDDEELDRFAAAWRAVERMERRGFSEDRQIRAIRAEGLSLERYNHIATLVETYQSVENEVADRLGRGNRR